MINKDYFLIPNILLVNCAMFHGCQQNILKLFHWYTEIRIFFTLRKCDSNASLHSKRKNIYQQ